MICDALRRLSAFGRLDSYRYIGFGSTFFSDFVLFHKALGIRNMLSIEHDIDNRDRFEFNRPFSCVEIRYGESTDVLATLDWNVRTILWLDYDCRLDRSVLSDVELFCMAAQPGSVLVVTVDARPDQPPDGCPIEERDTYRLEELKRRLDADTLSPELSKSDLTGWGIAQVSRDIMNTQILHIINERNAARDPQAAIMYKQLFHFWYDDGAKMLTTGGLLYDAGQSALVDGCDFGSLFFLRTGDRPYAIEVPVLTHREIYHLDRNLPVDDCSKLDSPPLPLYVMTAYADLYRYFPVFAETEM
jgi:uncharacterized membrane protein